MEQYISPDIELVLFGSSNQIAFQVYSEGGGFGENTNLPSVVEPEEGFEEW